MNSSTTELALILGNASIALQTKLEATCQTIEFITEAEMLTVITTHIGLTAKEKIFLIEGIQGFKAAAKAKAEADAAREIAISKMTPAELSVFLLKEEVEKKEKAERDAMIASISAKAHGALNKAVKVKRGFFSGVGYVVASLAKDVVPSARAGWNKVDGVK